jgi:uncharacterized membrane protein YeaQ/YmgE (transglycosylase-associated protein family)
MPGDSGVIRIRSSVEHGICYIAARVSFGAQPSRKGEVRVIGIIAWIVVGLIAGALAKWVMPGPDPGGIIVTILIGIAGAFVGGYVLSLLGGPGMSGVSLGSILTATLGAIILLAVYRLITRRAA